MENDNTIIFNNLADCYKNPWIKDKKERQRIIDIVNKFGIKKGMQILEPGCGNGEFTPFILKKIGKKGVVWLVDISDKMLKIAKRNLKNKKNLRYINCCASKIPVEKNFFDMVIVFNSFPHFYPKKIFIKEFYRVLKNNGFLIIAHDFPREKINRIHNKANFDMDKNLLPGKREMFKMLKKQGFVIKRYDNKVYYLLIAIKIIYNVRSAI